MERDMHPIDELFKGALNEYEMTPPADAWFNIEQKLVGKKHAQFLVIVRALAASVALMIAFAGGYYFAYYKNINKIAESNNQILPTHNLQEKSISPPVKAKLQETKANPNTYTPPSLLMATPDNRQNQIIAEPKEQRIIPANELSNREQILISYLSPVSAFIQISGVDKHEPIAMPLNKSLETKPLDEVVVLTDAGVTTEESKRSRWSLGAQVSPLYAYRDTRSANATTSGNYYNSLANQEERGIISYSGGMNVEYKASKRLSVASGLYYSRMGQNIKGSQYYASNASIDYNGSQPSSVLVMANSTGSIQTNSGTIRIEQDGNLNKVSGANNISSTRQIDLLQNMDFLEIPVMVRYRVIDRKIGLHLLGGLSTNILMDNKVKMNDGSGNSNVGNTSGLATMNYSSTMGLGLNYAITGRMHLNLEPAFKYYLNSINASRSLDTHPYSFGVYTGLSYTF